MADHVEEIKAKLDIKEVVGSYVQLKKAGVNWKGLCPFHSEKSPSFVVSPEKQICHCFGCSKGGDIFSFIQEVEGVSFVEAMEILGERAGVKIDKKKMAKKAGKSEKDEYFKAHELACSLFEKELWSSNDGKKVLEYLRKRGLTDDTIKDFRIGFAPDKYDFLYPLLLKKGISKNVLIKSGLVSAKNLASDSIYDKFRQRLIFPVFDYLGKICAFGGRALSKEQMPKYLNSPENIIYSKSKVLYGLHRAKKSIKEEGRVVLVEGYFDVILPHQAGITNVVSTSGTALTKEQARILKRITAKAVSCFDADNAGFEATKRAYHVLQVEGLQMKTIANIEGKDPADFVLNHGDKFNDLVEEADNFVTFYVDSLLLKFDVQSLEGRVAVLKELMPLYKEMAPTVRDFYVRELAQKLNVGEKSLYDEIDRFKLPVSHPARVAEPKGTAAVKKKFTTAELIIGLVGSRKHLMAKLLELDCEGCFDGYLKSVYKELSQQYNAARDQADSWKFKGDLLASDGQNMDVLMIYAQDRYSEFAELALESELEKLVDSLKKDRRSDSLREIQKKISEAEQSGDKEALMELLTEQQKIISS